MDKLDLHYIKEDPDFGIVSEGVLFDDVNDIISRIDKVKNTVKTINLNNQQALKEIPSVLGECKLLENLNISHTGITEIPDFLFALPNLRNLSCCCSGIHSFPMGIFNTRKLERLHIRINKNWTPPEDIPLKQKENLLNLKYLAVDLYTSTTMPSNLGILENLEQLLLAAKYTEGGVPALPYSLENHPSLKEVSIVDPFHKHRKNLNLEYTVKILSTCKKLEALTLSGFAVGKGHQALSMLTNLKKLDMGHLLTEGNIFNSVRDLRKLEKLGIWGSEFKINEIPDIFTNMEELREFSFAGNMITTLPTSIYSLVKLKNLAIGSTGITMLDEKIGELQNLENIHVYDSLLNNLPDAVFTMPRLKVLNIEENVFSVNEINNIKEKLNTLKQNGQNVEFTYDRQGHRKMVKKLRVINADSSVDSMDAGIYAKHCLNAVNENPFAIKYVNTAKLKNSGFYAKLCLAAVKKTCLALENITCEALSRQSYFTICMEAARHNDIANAFKLIRSELLTNNGYIQICVEAALHNKSADFIANFNNEVFQKRFSRKVYEHICWTAVLHNPRTINKMINPTEEILNLNERCK